MSAYCDVHLTLFSPFKNGQPADAVVAAKARVVRTPSLTVGGMMYTICYTGTYTGAYRAEKNKAKRERERERRGVCVFIVRQNSDGWLAAGVLGSSVDEAGSSDTESSYRHHTAYLRTPFWRGMRLLCSMQYNTIITEDSPKRTRALASCTTPFTHNIFVF